MLSFVSIKFVALGLSSARSLVLAAILGPKSYGVFGTLILVQQYISYAALGMREGVAVVLARSPESKFDILDVHTSALAWGACVGLGLWISAGIAYRALDETAKYVLLIAVISSLSILNEILININRDQNKLRKIALLEVAYNAVPLGVALWLWKDVTIAAVLVALAIGLLISVTTYLATLPHWGSKHAQWSVARRLIAIGFPVAALSAVAMLANSIYIILANWIVEADALGLIVFANTICTIVLFAFNTVAWGATSRSMRNEYAGQDTEDVRLRTAFRVGTAAAALVCLASAFAFNFVLKDYAGAEVYAFYLCLFQAYGLLLFSEINHLTVTGRSHLVILGYCTLLALVWSTHYTFPGATITTLMIVGIIGYGLLAHAAAWYCEVLRKERGRGLSKFVFLMFPVTCALLHASSGRAAAAIACVAFAVLALWSHRSKAAQSERPI